MDYDKIQALLPEGAKITKVYSAFENGELRIIVLLSGEQYETRYVAHFDGDDVTLKHRP